MPPSFAKWWPVGPKAHAPLTRIYTSDGPHRNTDSMTISFPKTLKYIVFYIVGFFILHLCLPELFTNSPFENKARVKTFMESSPMLLFWMLLLVLGLVSDAIGWFLHAKVGCFGVDRPCRCLFEMIPPQTCRWSSSYYVGWTRGKLVFNNSLSLAYLRTRDPVFHKVSFLSSTLLFVAPMLG